MFSDLSRVKARCSVALGVDFSRDRAAIDGGSGAGSLFGAHRLERLLARSHVLLGGKYLDDDGRALIGVVKELDSERDDALRRPPSLLDTSLETLDPFRVDVGEADNSYVH